MEECIELEGGRIHNLKNISLKIPKNKIVVFTGVSGSGKSSLAFDILFEEGRTRYFQAIGMPPRLESEKSFDILTGLSPTIAVEQRTLRLTNPRSTVGTRTSIYNYMRMLYAAESHRLCPICKEPVGTDYACPLCGMKADRLFVKHFSFNEPSGMCPNCQGRGYIQSFRIERIIPDPSKTLFQICADATTCFADLRTWIPSLAQYYKFDEDTPYEGLPEKIQKMFLYGTDGKKISIEFTTKQYTHKTDKEYEGVIPHLQRALEKGSSELRTRKIEQNYMDKILCPDCQGFRINQQAREALIHEKHIGQLANMSIGELIAFFQILTPVELQTSVGKPLVNKILFELRKFEQVGIDYLHLNRGIRTLSGGEAQRLSLLAQLSLGLNNVVLILDEPTMGMHEVEKARLASILKELRDANNTVLVVEHDEQIIRLADQLVELGPGAGIEGGEIVFQGSLGDMMKSTSLTGKYLSHQLQYPQKAASQRRKTSPKSALHLKHISMNNLEDINVDIPLGCMVGIAGVSGSGKSSLISDALVPLFQAELKARKEQDQSNKSKLELKIESKEKSKAEENEESSESSENGTSDENGNDFLQSLKGTLSGANTLSELVVVDQSPIGRNRNSFPASYIGLWDYIRKLFAKQPLAKKKKFTDGHFSFNSDRGRCPHCKGEGKVSIAISFMDEISVSCEECGGKRYLPEILEIEYHGKTIRDILELSVKDAIEVFVDEPKILQYLKILDRIGMGYITLGQPATTLSGGEAQRIKLAKALGNTKNKNVLYILDEPTTGLHFHDEVKLLALMEELVNQGNSMIVIEHETNVLRNCDWIIELGPGGGPQGGKIIAEGTPEMIHQNKNSIIQTFLKVK